ncbi:MAG: hypothetical protein WAM71_01450 [Candidatus Korobacteraceae bacterium]
MSSPFSSALGRLDESLQNIRSQLDQLGAALEVNSEQLNNMLADAWVHGEALRDLIRAERPDVKWADRESLGQVVQNLEAAIQRNQERRAKLLGLAAELEVGSVKHRFQARSTELNNLRLQAINELRAEASVQEQEKELPGPGASEWLDWVCNLQDDKDASALTDLRKDFPAVEHFAGEMELAYWVPGEVPQNGSANGSAGSNGSAEQNAGSVYGVAPVAVVAAGDKLPPVTASGWQSTAAIAANEYVQSKA